MANLMTSRLLQLGAMGLSCELFQAYAENICLRFPEVFLSLGSPELEKGFEPRSSGYWRHRVVDTPAGRIVEIFVPRRSECIDIDLGQCTGESGLEEDASLGSFGIEIEALSFFGRSSTALVVAAEPGVVDAGRPAVGEEEAELFVMHTESATSNTVSPGSGVSAATFAAGGPWQREVVGSSAPTVANPLRTTSPTLEKLARLRRSVQALEQSLPARVAAELNEQTRGRRMEGLQTLARFQASSDSALLMHPWRSRRSSSGGSASSQSSPHRSTVSSVHSSLAERRGKRIPFVDTGRSERWWECMNLSRMHAGSVNHLNSEGVPAAAAPRPLEGSESPGAKIQRVASRVSCQR